MEDKFHRDSATIYDFAKARRPASTIEPSRERIAPRLFSAEVVALQGGKDSRRQTVIEPTVAYADFGSGWYHDVAIERTDPPRH